MRELKVGGPFHVKRASGFRTETIKSLQETEGRKMPTKAYYEDGTTIQNGDKLVRIVLTNGMIHYLKAGTYKILN